MSRGAIDISAVISRCVSDEMERAVLASVLLEPSVCLPQVRSLLTVDDFSSDRHQLVFQSLLRLADAGVVPDIRTVQADLERRGQFEPIGGLAYLSGLDLDLPDWGRVRAYVDVVKENSVRRRTVRELANAIQAVHLGKEAASQILHRTAGQLRELQGAVTRSRPVHVGELVAGFLEDLDQHGLEALAGLPTGFRDYDALGSAILPGKLVVYAGRPGMGKTTWLLNILSNLGDQKIPSSLFSLEMDKRTELTPKLICLRGDIPFKRMTRGLLSQRQWNDFARASRDVAQLPIHIDDMARLSLSGLEASCRLMKAEHDVRVFGIDYLQLLHVEGRRFENRRSELAYITRALKQLAGELEGTVILLSQLSRDNEKRGGDMKPRLSDLADSGATEADADQVTFIHRPEVYNPETEDRGICWLLTRKFRGGEIGDAKVGFDAPTGRFFNLDQAQPALPAAQAGDPF